MAWTLPNCKEVRSTLKSNGKPICGNGKLSENSRIHGKRINQIKRWAGDYSLIESMTFQTRRMKEHCILFVFLVLTKTIQELASIINILLELFIR
jgi:hypothetical protein